MIVPPRASGNGSVKNIPVEKGKRKSVRKNENKEISPSLKKLVEELIEKRMATTMAMIFKWMEEQKVRFFKKLTDLFLEIPTSKKEATIVGARA